MPPEVVINNVGYAPDVQPKYDPTDYELIIAILNTTKQIVMDKDWCQGFLAQGTRGEPRNIQTETEKVDAVCLLGALTLAHDKHEVGHDISHFIRETPAEAALRHILGTGLPNFNDTIAESKEDLITAIDDAIAYIGESNRV